MGETLLSVGLDVGTTSTQLVVSELTVREELESGKLLSFDLDAGGLFRNIYLAWRKDIALTSVEKKFVDYVISQSDKM